MCTLRPGRDRRIDPGQAVFRRRQACGVTKSAKGWIVPLRGSSAARQRGFSSGSKHERRKMRPREFDGEWFPAKRALPLAWLGPIGLSLAGSKGTGVTDDALMLKGFGIEDMAWDGVVDIRR
ncbi:MAG: hypothetical protein ACI9U2_003126 [Bradymonadia bacterium]|jgi:hypothetical protein